MRCYRMYIGGSGWLLGTGLGLVLRGCGKEVDTAGRVVVMFTRGGEGGGDSVVPCKNVTRLPGRRGGDVIRRRQEQDRVQLRQQKRNAF